MANFETKNDGTWFYFDESDPEQGGVCLRELSIDEHDRIERMTVKSRKKVKRGVAYDDVEVDEKLARKMRWDYCIVDWSNISLDGVPVECTSENKQKLTKVLAFIKFLVDCLEKLTEAASESAESRLKN